MKLLIWGAGAIGGTIGAYLARAGHDVVFVDVVEEHVAAINERGLSITGPIDEFTVTAQAYTPESLAGEYETVLLCVKAQDTRAAAKSIAPYLSADGYIVSVQNGLNELVIKEIVGAERTVGAFVNFGADYMGPGTVLFGGRGAVVLGELDGAHTERIAVLHSAFLDFDKNAIVTDNIFGYLWGKLAYGAQLFVTALTNDSIADCLADPDYRDLYIAIAKEVLRVAAAKDITPQAFNGFDPNAFLPDAPMEVSVKSLDEMVAHNRKSAKTHSGIWRDLAVRKRRTEADAQLGPIVDAGKRSGVPTPLTTRLLELVHDIEDGIRPQERENLDLLMELI
ncbi:MAG: ketopantoate reductase family protein [Caldilineaceae bacterium]